MHELKRWAIFDSTGKCVSDTAREKWRAWANVGCDDKDARRLKKKGWSCRRVAIVEVPDEH